MKASVLAVGTELTSGQIVNRNASSVSERLKKLGVQVSCHLTVPDDRGLILDALKYCEKHSDLIFATGGLGPTSDDFTREVVSQWAELELVFDENSWQHVTDRLNSRGFTVRDMQRQQCYFPRGAKILSNSEGTANAFKFTKDKTHVFVLPGPPREIDAVWKTHLATDLQQLTSNLNKQLTLSWDTIGVGESEVAFQVEKVLEKRPQNLPFEIGYRVHLPYVEVKLTYSEKDHATWSPWVEQVEQVLSDITISRNFTDVAELALTSIRDLDFVFYDYLSAGFLHSRLSHHIRQLKNWRFQQSQDSPVAADFFDAEENFMALLPFENFKCIILISIEGKRHQKVCEAPNKSPLMHERRLQYFAEMALVELAQCL